MMCPLRVTATMEGELLQHGPRHNPRWRRRIVFPQHYDFRVKGTLPASIRDVFLPLSTSVEGGGTVTVLSGVIADQAELSGVLSTIDGLGLVLLELRPATENSTT